MTNRCRILAVLGLLGSLLGALRGQDSLTVMSLALLVWMFSAWCIFQIRCNLAFPHIRCARQLNGRSATSATLWSGRTANVDISVTTAKARLPTLLIIRDWIPESLEMVAGAGDVIVSRSVRTVAIQYACRVLSAGNVHFPGLQLQFVDPAGLFVSERFLAAPHRVRCLPTFAQPSDARPTIKRVNSLPQHGIHRLQRAGLGSELLELREYQSGDPPKSIAWKVSARRDKLMTRQYESEVPVRITLLVDGAGVQRLGGFGLRPIDQVNYVAASVARAAVSAGDSIGLVLVDEHRVSYRKPAAGERAFYQVLEALADFAAQPPRRAPQYSSALLKTAIAVCSRRYPELLLPKLNRTAFTWLPVSLWKRRLWHGRQRIANVIGQLERLTPSQVCQLFYDDAALALAIQRLLFDNGLAMMPPITHPVSSVLEHEVTTSTRQLGKALTDCVARARDNEVFVLLTDWIDRPADFDCILACAKVAIARHHRVVFLGSSAVELESRASASESRDRSSRLVPADIERDILLRADALKRRDRMKQTQREVRRIGASIAYLSDSKAIWIVLAEAELAGSGRTLMRSLH